MDYIFIDSVDYISIDSTNEGEILKFVQVITLKEIIVLIVYSRNCKTNSWTFSIPPASH